MTCPTCGGDARCIGLRGKGVVGLLGPMRLDRHYYHCPDCRHGLCPFDQVLGLTAADLTPAADEITCLAGTQAPFAEAAEKALPKLAGLRLSESTVERATEAAGRRLAEALQGGATFGAAPDWDWHRDAEGKTVAYVSADATGVGQQGEGGAKAEGRMANVVALFNPVPEEADRWAEPTGPRPRWQGRYLAGLRPLVEFTGAARRQGAQVGMDRAERWIALSDGGAGLEDWLRATFPRVEAVILDFYHVAEYLGELAQAWHPKDQAAAEEQRQAWCHRLKHEGGTAVLAELQQLDRRGRGAAAREVHARVVGYFANQVHRMDYPTYVGKGWHIGSGTVESACKTVVGMRLKGAGMRWSAEGADALCHLRALFRSEKGQWEAFWSRN
jgi:hypothetical protein